MARPLYPATQQAPYGQATFGATPQWPTLDALLLAPPLHLPGRLVDIAKLGREPTPWDVETVCQLGGFETSLPLVVPAMGSTPIAHERGVDLARAAAHEGLILVLGENIASVHGYDEPREQAGTTFKDRIMAYLDVLASREASGFPALGGVVIQQSVEDAMDELWWRVYTDPDLEPHVAAGRIGFEIKVGQGAKAGLGGVTLVHGETARRLDGEYRLGDHDIDAGDGTTRRERFSAPGTFTTDILEAQVRHLRNDFPRARAWVKLPASRDAILLAHAAAAGGADLVTLDGAEGGTALAPTVFLQQVGLPLLALAARLRASPLPAGCDVVLSGGLQDGAHLVKALALGADGVAFGRQLLQATVEGGVEGARRRIAELTHEARMVTYAMGHLSIDALDEQCLLAVDESMARSLGIPWAFDVEAPVSAPHQPSVAPLPRST